MAINNEINRLNQAKSNIKSSIESKGISVPENTKISDMHQYIDLIPKDVNWDEVVGKPTTFPPTTHTHNATDIVADATHRFVTDAEKSTWNGKETTTGSQEKATQALTDAKIYTNEQLETKQPIGNYLNLDAESEQKIKKSLSVGGSISCGWLRSTMIPTAGNKKTNSVVTVDDQGWLYHRTLSQFLLDLEAAPLSHTHDAADINTDTTHNFVTDTEKSNWNAKETTTGSQAKATKALTDAKSYTDTKVSEILNSAPETLDTLNELAAALGDDPNFATTVSTEIGKKADKTYTDQQLATKQPKGNYAPEVHSHDDLYYTETEIDTKLKKLPIDTVAQKHYLLSVNESVGADAGQGKDLGFKYDTQVYLQNNVLYGAAWNDFAEYRKCVENYEPGTVVCEVGDGTLKQSIKHLQLGASIISDTYGMVIGDNQSEKTKPIAVAGRVLVKYNGDIGDFKPGAAVCAGVDGAIEIMTREEIIHYPDAIIGYVSEIPTYKEWNNIEINKRIWIKIH